MLKLFYVIFMNLHRAPYMIPRMRAEADHPQRYTEEQRYSLVQHAIYLMNKTGKINTVETGAENLPKQGGYMMYPNHQGKYDVLGITGTTLGTDLQMDERLAEEMKKKADELGVKEGVLIARGVLPM